MTLYAWADEVPAWEPVIGRQMTADEVPYVRTYFYSGRRVGKEALLLEVKQQALEFERQAIIRGHKPFTPSEKRRTFEALLLLHTAPAKPGTYVRQMHAMGMLDPHQATFQEPSANGAPMYLRPWSPTPIRGCQAPLDTRPRHTFLRDSKPATFAWPTAYVLPSPVVPYPVHHRK